MTGRNNCRQCEEIVDAGQLLDVLGRMEVWLAHHGRAGLTAEDRAILAPRFEKLSRDATSVGALSLDLVNEMKTAA